jgi:hypothetical protein
MAPPALRLCVLSSVGSSSSIDLSRPFCAIFLHIPTSCRHTDADLRACFLRGPFVSERTTSERSVFRLAWREMRCLGRGSGHPLGAKESFHVSFPAGRTVERTTPYARGDRGFVAGYKAATVAGHLLFLGREGQAPLVCSSSLIPSPLCPNLSRILSLEP